VARITITLADDVDTRLRLEARRRGSSIAAVVRSAIDRHLSRPSAAGRLSCFAIGEGSPADASVRVEGFVAQAIGRRRVARST
jgi:Ribbon-helix-helix protein, copG family